MAPFVLSENDRSLLQQMLNWYRTLRPKSKAGSNQPLVQSPDVYIALPPSGGIPALSLVGSSPAAGDTPGSATCDIYKINSSGDTEAYTGLDKTVYNVSTSIVTEQWIIIERSKQGKWVISPIGSGAASYKVTTFPYWDATEKELFIRAIPTPSDEDSQSNQLETANVITGVVSGDVVIFLPGIFMDEGRTTSEAQSIRPGLRVWAVSANNRLELVSFPTPEIARYVFNRDGSNNLPPYAVTKRVGGNIHQVDANSGVISSATEAAYGDAANSKLGNLSGVNGSWAVGANAGTGGNEVATRGSGGHGLSSYIFVRVNQTVLGTSDIRMGQMWGPTPLDYELYPGIPGFVLMLTESSPTALGDGAIIYSFLQVPGFQTACAKATETWTNATSPSEPYVVCNPVLIASQQGPSGTIYPYDGSTTGPSGNTMPLVEIIVYLPRNSTERDPNIQVGNLLWYKQAGPQRSNDPVNSYSLSNGLPEFVCVGDYLDDKIDTVKFWAGSSGSIPQGWVERTGSAGKYIKCANIAGGTGTFGTTGTDHNFFELICIQRTT